ncbi:MAG: hypothetical protein KC535_03245 [Nanoarchaeota archaeon]|nr:hypothetical protein [Nanoarchaeota archaeon]
MFGIDSKKGFAYLLIVSIFVAVLLVVFLTYNSYSYAKTQELHEERILTMNNFVMDFNEDIHRATFISSFRALVGLEDHIASSGEFLNDTELAFQEVFYNGTIDGKKVLIMTGSSFSDYIDKVNALANNVGIISNIEISYINLSQDDPWTISVNVHAIVNVSDYRETASWSYEDDFTTNLPIYNLRDPLYSFFTSNKVPNTIRPYLSFPLVNGSDASSLQALIDGSYYIASNQSPSFLQRFENSTLPNQNGIESIVDINVISDQDLAVYPDRVKVDFIYFNDLPSDKICTVENISVNSYFVIPSNRTDLYEIGGLNYSTTCP